MIHLFFFVIMIFAIRQNNKNIQKDILFLLDKTQNNQDAIISIFEKIKGKTK